MELPSGEIEVKSGIEIKRLDAEGAGLARIATLSAVDEDGDTYAEGAFGEFVYGEGRYFHDVDEPTCNLRDVHRYRTATSSGQEGVAILQKYTDRGIRSGLRGRRPGRS
ncbi:hypothetical protein LCGC14_3073240, partial [marine sediment metagenome]